MNFLRQIIYYLLIITIPLQIGKHFWPDFSFVNGIRVDYLSPTVYVSDIAFVFLFLASFRTILKKFLHPILLLVLVALVISWVTAIQPAASFYGLVKFLEFSYIAYYTAYMKKDNAFFRFLFILGGLCQTVIILLQFVSQSSIGGLFYYLGERTFTASTQGIATFRWGSEQVLRSYGTFPHPNVAAFYLLIGFTFLLFSLRFRHKVVEYAKLIAISILLLGMILTFSRIVLLLVFFVLVLRFLTLKKRLKKTTILALFSGSSMVFGFLIIILYQRFEEGIFRDGQLRLELIKIAFQVALQNPLLGVGLNNFFHHEVMYQKTVTPILLQPVHNIYLMWITQTGLLGSAVLIIFLRKLFGRILYILKNTNWSSFSLPIAVLVMCAGIIGLFDHYLLTLQQGQLMLAVLLGLLFGEVTAQGKGSVQTGDT